MRCHSSPTACTLAWGRALRIHMVTLPKKRMSQRVALFNAGRLLNHTDIGTSAMKSCLGTRIVPKNGERSMNLSRLTSASTRMRYARGMEAKSPSASFTEMTELVLPQHTNAIGTAFGGTIMSWIDIGASIAAKRHCGRVAVTARVEALEFRAPIRVGDVVRLTARLNAAFRSSMEIGVRVEREDRYTGERAVCADARATFVNLGDDGKPAPVPPLLLESDEDRRLSHEAHERREQRQKQRR